MREFKVSSHDPVVVDLRLATLHGRFVRLEPLRREHAREGVWRHHRLMPDGHRRDSVVYSILEAGWPGVKKRLHGFLEGYGEFRRHLQGLPSR